jgi:hypothetical protein
LVFFRLRGLDFARGSEPDTYPGAALAGNFIRGVAQLNAAPVFFDDAPNNGKTEPRPLFPRRDIGLE